MLLNILRCTGQLPTTNNHPAQNISSAKEVKKPSPKLTAVKQGETGTRAT